MDNKENENKNNDNKFIVISGVTSGIGEGLVRALTKSGHLVAGFGRREDKLDALYKDLNIDKKEHPLLFSCIDITNEEKVKKWSESIVKQYNRTPDIVIHNAGLAINDGKNVIDCNLKDVTLSFDIMVKGAYILTQSFLSIILNDVNYNKKQNCVFLYMSSWSGHIGYAGGSKYCVAKHAIEGFVKCLAKEFDEMRNGNNDCKLSAIAICPGVVHSELFQDNAMLNEYLGMFEVENGIKWSELCKEWILNLGLKENGLSIGPSSQKSSLEKFANIFGIENISDYIRPTGAVDKEKLDK